MNRFLKNFWLNFAWLLPVTLIINTFGWLYFFQLTAFSIIVGAAAYWYRVKNLWTP